MTKYITGLDFETTGKDPNDCKVVEACFIMFHPETREVYKKVNFLVNPGLHIPKQASDIHHITDDMVKSKPSIEKYIPVILSVLNQTSCLVAHNGNHYDFPILARILEKHADSLQNIRLYDTMENGRFATDLGKAPSLQELCFALDVDYNAEASHRSEYDVERMMECFFNGIDYGYYDFDGEVN